MLILDFQLLKHFIYCNSQNLLFCQIYPETPQQLELITSIAIRAGFGGGVVVDYPNSSKAKKIFLCLFCGVAPKVLPKGLDGHEQLRQNEVRYSKSAAKMSRVSSRKPLKGTKEWIEAKKERRRRQGKSVQRSSKYSGRRRKNRV